VWFFVLLEPLEKVGWMSGIILAIIGVYLQLIGAIPPPYNYFVFIIAIAILGVTAISTKSHSAEKPIKVEIVGKTPVLELEPLRHHRGLPVPLSISDLKHKHEVLMELAKQYPMQNLARKGDLPTEFTDPEGKSLEPSQWLSQYDFDFNNLVLRGKLRVKFGVIRVRSLSGTVKACKAQVRYRVLEDEGKAKDEKWIEGGFLNWYSPELRSKMFVVGLDRSAWTYGINRYLLNSEQTIPDRETRDLWAFYMIEDVPNVHLCSSMESAPLGWAKEYPVKFEIELTVTGDDYPRTIWKFEGKVMWDDFSLTPS
jgi:hypothetical protein